MIHSIASFISILKLKIKIENVGFENILLNVLYLSMPQKVEISDENFNDLKIASTFHKKYLGIISRPTNRKHVYSYGKRHVFSFKK